MIARPQRGFALVVVLWSITLLAFLVTGISAIGRSESQIASNLSANAMAEARADSAVYQTIFQMLRRGGDLEPAGAVAVRRTPDGTAEIRIEDLGGRIGLNVAPAPVLQALLQRLGVEPGRSSALAAAIADWRSPNLQPSPHGAKAPQYRAAGLPYGPPNAPFHEVDELRLVLGMTPELFARMAPFVSVHQDSDPDPLLAGPVVAAAMADVRGTPASATVSDAMHPVLAAITASVAGADGGRFTRYCVVRLGVSGSDGSEPPYRILAWEAPDG